MLIPLATKKYWNSGRSYGSDINGYINHTPLADAIMFGDVEMVKILMPCTRIKANPKHRFSSYLHVAVKHGQFEIFKIICDALIKKKFDWKKLKDLNDRNAYDLLRLLVEGNENMRIPVLGQKNRSFITADHSVKKKFQEDVEKYIIEIMMAKVPEGWECRLSRSTGQSYYINKFTGQSQWETPTEPATVRVLTNFTYCFTFSSMLKKLVK